VRRLIAIIALIALICQAEARHERFSAAEQSDEWIHEFFSNFLKEFETSLRDMAKSEVRINETEKIRETLEIVSGEIEFYRAGGIESNASLAIGPFLLFSRNLNALALAQQDFLSGMRNLKEGRGDYETVAAAISKARGSIAEMRRNLDDIDTVVLYNNTTPLHFNTSAIREALDEVEQLFNLYESLSKAYEVEGIWVFVSKQNAVLFEKIRIWVYARNVTPTGLFIDERRFEPGEMEYSFETLGKHFIYAEGIRGNERVRSKVVEVNAIKIPTYIFLSPASALISEEAEVKGLIWDYYSARMSVPLKVSVDGKEQNIEARDGLFSLKIRRDYECGVRVEAFYEGNETHERARAEETVYFLRFPVWIKIESEKQRANAGEDVAFRGTASESVPVEIIVNSEKKMDLQAGRNFSFSLKFTSPGRYVVYARFPGDELRRPAESNRVEITVVEPFMHRAVQWVQGNYLMLIILLSALLVSAFALEKFGKRARPPEKREEAKLEEKAGGIREEKKEEAKQRTPEEAFRQLFDVLVNKFGLKRSLTPRELLRELKGQGFSEKLREVVELHEKFAYAGIGLSKEEEERFFKLVSEIISQL